MGRSLISKTIADFRRENARAFKAAFCHIVVVCRKLDLFGRELLAIDGTRLKAVNSTERHVTREKLKTMLHECVCPDLATIKWTRGSATSRKHNRYEYNAKQVRQEI